LYENTVIDNDVNILKINGLEHFCDVIHSCQSFFCLITGAATLAAALRKSTTVFYIDGVHEMFLHSKLHKYTHL
jgi:ADP-heptose:LPS heptosyltransferase